VSLPHIMIYDRSDGRYYKFSVHWARYLFLAVVYARGTWRHTLTLHALSWALQEPAEACDEHRGRSPHAHHPERSGWVL